MKISILLLAILIPVWLVSQHEGTITYVETTKFEFDAPEGMEDMFKDMPSSRSTTKSLIFDQSQSLYSNLEAEDFETEQTIESDNGQMNFQIKIDEPDNRYFNDLTNQKITRQQEFLGKNFLIQDDLRKYDWKVSTERRKILDYVCMKATTVLDTATSVEAWFAPGIAVSTGPESYNGLPGVILMIDVNNGQNLIVAKEVNLDKVDNTLFVKPSKGKKVSRSEFEKIREEKLAEMNAISGGSGVQMIIRH